MSASRTANRHWSSMLLVWLISLLFLCDVGLSLCLSRKSASVLTMNKYQDFFSSQRHPEVIVLGSSAALIPNLNCDMVKIDGRLRHLGSIDYLDAKYFAQMLEKKSGKKVTTANLAMNGAMVSDDWLIAQKSVEFGKSPKVIVYEMTSRDFFDASMPELGRTPVFSDVSHLHPKGSYAFLPAQVVEFADWVWSSPFVASVSTMLLDTKFLCDAERFRTSFDAIAASLCFSYKERGQLRKWLTARACSLTNRSPSVYESTRKALEERKKLDPFGSLSAVKTGSIEVDSRPQQRRFDDELFFFERLLKLCKQEGIVLIVIDMPMGEAYAAKVPPVLRERYPSQIVSLCRSYGARYFNFNQPGWFSTRDFSDFIHLSVQGSVKFTELVAAEMSKHGLVGAGNSSTR